MALTLVHELSSEGKHRIVAIADDGTNSTGEWFEVRDLAWHLDCFAVADPCQGFTQGIYSFKLKNHQVLA